MKQYELDPEEQEILDAWKAGEYKPVENFEEEKKRFMEIAKNSNQKTRNITQDV